jgi:thiosulfate dehydrogenase
VQRPDCVEFFIDLQENFAMRRPGFWLVLVAAAIAPLSFAQDSALVQARQIATLGKGEAVPACGSCHGQKGEGVAVFPRLAATGQAYLAAQLEAFADGSRDNPIMQPIARALSAGQRSAMAAYYSQLPAPLKTTDAAQALPTNPGAWLATRGRWDDQVPACSKCHGGGGGGLGANFPPLAGQSADYIAAQLQAWKTGKRPPGPLGLMQVIAGKLSDSDVQAVSAYYAGLGSAAPSPVAAASATQPPAAPAAERAGFRPPAETTFPEGEYGRIVRLGQQLMLNTRQFAGPYVGNELSCTTCHLDAGRKGDAAPLWGAFIHYPQFRAKTGKVDTLAARIQQCFEYSMNGKAPPTDGEIITALQSYAAWLARGAPVGVPLAGSGFTKLKKPAVPADYSRGEKLYAANCALCHGADGQGQRVGTQQPFPPLWGPRSYNWGAGMHQLGNASSFIRHNMPLGKGGSLSDQEAWDIAVFMNSHDRPQDPRFITSVTVTREKFHDTDDSLYGTTVNGHLLGSNR